MQPYEVNDHLRPFGFTDDQLITNIKRVSECAGRFATNLTSHAVGQAIHDRLTNLPCGIIEQAREEDAFRHGLVATVGAFYSWEPDEVIELCRLLLEEFNLHEEAAQFQLGAAENRDHRRALRAERWAAEMLEKAAQNALTWLEESFSRDQQPSGLVEELENALSYHRAHGHKNKINEGTQQ
jgi:hypothetical protein